MKPALKVVATTTPERANLAAAIAEAAPAVAEVDKARSKAEAARGAFASALGAVPAAERAVAEAKAHLIEDPSSDRSSLRSLRQAETDARDDLEIAREVVARAEAVLVEVERAAKFAMKRIEAAADAVIVANFAPALDAAERAGREFGRLAFAARIIASAGNNWNGERTQLMATVDSLNAHFAFRGDPAAIASARHSGQVPWQIARDALLTNADAVLPEIGG